MICKNISLIHKKKFVDKVHTFRVRFNQSFRLTDAFFCSILQCNLIEKKSLHNDENTPQKLPPPKDLNSPNWIHYRVLRKTICIALIFFFFFFFNSNNSNIFSKPFVLFFIGSIVAVLLNFRSGFSWISPLLVS